MNPLQKCYEKKLITPPDYVVSDLQYLTMMGSIAYGVSSDSSDVDIYGFCIPPKSVVFPHLDGVIHGFGRQIQNFEQYQQHHIKYADDEYDFTVYSIVKFFQLCMQNNPNMIDSLFVPENCVLFQTDIGKLVRERRNIFLHKGAWHRFKGYAYSQLHKIRLKNPIGKRKILVAEHGYDIKFAYHVVRLLNEVEQIMIEGTLDITRNREQLKSIRRGEWTIEQIEKYFVDKEKALEQVYASSKLQHSPDEEKIKALLLDCLEQHYGSISLIPRETEAEKKLKQIKAICNNF